MTYLNNDMSKSFDLIRQWLIGTIFIGFRFSSNFTLFFDLDSEVKFAGKELPWQLELALMEEWWIGERQDWDDRVIKHGVGIEPDEPIKAFDLTRLRWTKGAIVSDVFLDDSKLKIVFQNGTTLETKLTPEDEYNFALYEYGKTVENSTWSIVLDTEGIHTKTPIRF